jgi:hypothetical protein
MSIGSSDPIALEAPSPVAVSKPYPRLRGLRRFGAIPEVRAATLLAIVVTAVSVVISQLPVFAEAQQHLGAEYFNIARALADGRGYSDPFGEHTGPTAWMPPAYPTLLAGLLYVLKTRSLVAAGVIFLTNLTLIGVGTTLYAIARRSSLRVPAYVSLILYIGWILAFVYWFFVVTSDVWLLMLLSNFIGLAIFDHVRTGKVRPVAWGCLGGLAALTSPTLGMSAGCLMIWSLVRARFRPLRQWLLTVAIAGALLAPWTIRNALVFHKFVPIKSNAGFELYQANVLDGDGIYDAANMTKHPFNMQESRFRYAQYGETDFVEAHRRVFMRQFRRDPSTMLSRIENRFRALWIYHPLAEGQEGPWGLAIRRFAYVLPLSALLISLWVRGRHRATLWTLAIMIGAYLGPYIAIAFYVRYFIALTPLLLLALYFGIDQLAAWYAERKQRAVLAL